MFTVSEVLAESIALMMEAARTSETLVNFYQTAWRCNPEDCYLPHTVQMVFQKSVNISEDSIHLEKDALKVVNL
jgi:hypothetical protein